MARVWVCCVKGFGLYHMFEHLHDKRGRGKGENKTVEEGVSGWLRVPSSSPVLGLLPYVHKNF